MPASPHETDKLLYRIKRITVDNTMKLVKSMSALTYKTMVYKAFNVHATKEPATAGTIPTGLRQGNLRFG